MNKNINFYLSKGFDRKAAEYFSQGRKKLLSVTANSDFTLNLVFENNENRLYDIKPLLKKGTVFETFQDYKNFQRVYIDDSNNICWDIDPNLDSNINWNNKVDISSDTAYLDSELK